jgi:hypothetical protein
MNLFKREGNDVIFDPVALTIPEWRAIWDRDTTKDKEIAYQEIKYMYFMSEQLKEKNPYVDYTPGIKEKVIIKDHIRVPGWEADSLVKSAIKKYLDFQEETNGNLRLLNALVKTREKLTKFFNEIDVDERDEKTGKPIYKVGDIMKASKEAESMFTTIEKLDEKIRRESMKEKKGKAATNASDFET